jgi:hypothetical protein
MSAQQPDVSSLTTWEDAFQYPLPVVRKLEQQLRRNMEDNRQKLRTLVGASYRDLLGTAERIIDMDEQIQGIESHLGDIGRKCNARMLERIESNHVQMKKERATSEQARYGALAQTKVLQNALVVTVRIIKANEDALLASKLLVLARLLHKSVAESEQAPAVLGDLAKRMRRTRKRLLSYIERSLVRADVDKKFTLQTLCAYALISNSSPKDVLRHFLQVRFTQLESRAENASEADLMDALDLFQRTLADTRELFPKRFLESLSQISKVALTRDVGVRAVVELNLDVYEQWIAPDVRNFIPWISHESIVISEVKNALSSWARHAQKYLLQGLTDCLAQQTEAKQVLEMRHKVLSKYLSLGARFRDESQLRAINDMRGAFLAKLETLTKEAAELALSDMFPDAHDQSAGQGRDLDLWNLAGENLDLGRGATAFRQAVLRRQHGRSDGIRRHTQLFDEWIERLERTKSIAVALRATKWDDDVELDLDDLDDGETMLTALSKQDPQRLEEALLEAATATLRKTYTVIEEHAKGENVDVALHVRMLRELDLRKRGLVATFASFDTVSCDHAVVRSLHLRIATSVADPPLAAYSRWMRVLRYIPTSLWDGTPNLPVQPSTGTFRFLTDLHRQMSASGTDLWAPDAVQTLKASIIEQLAERDVFDVITAREVEVLEDDDHEEEDKVADEAETESTAKESKIDAQLREQHLQMAFDGFYLQRALQVSSIVGSSNDNVKASGEGRFSTTVDQLMQHVGLEPAAQERLRKNAHEYWRRTFLLFGLLSG